MERTGAGFPHILGDHLRGRRGGRTVLVFDSPCQKRPFCLSLSCVIKILVFLGSDQNSPRNYAKPLINNLLTVTLREVRYLKDISPELSIRNNIKVMLGPQGP